MFEKKAEGFFVLSSKGLEKQKQKNNEETPTSKIKALEKRIKDLENRLTARGL